MPTAPVIELVQYGPHGEAERPSLRAAQAYCRRLARTHYENFSVASWLLPRQLRQHFANIYAYCRWADDLADETGSRQKSLHLLAWWQDQLDDCYAGRAKHPVFVALAETIGEFDIPIAPFADLLAAFRQDQHQTRYETFDDLLHYCRHSANPVGRLVLYLGRCHNGQTAPLSDAVCTGLQLVNFWQDVRRDWEDRRRIYLPAETLRIFGAGEEEIGRGHASDAFRRALESEVARAENFLQAGWPLVELVAPPLRIEVELFIRGGLHLARAIRRQHFDVLSRRPVVGKWTKARLLVDTMWRQRCGGRRNGSPRPDHRVCESHGAAQ